MKVKRIEALADESSEILCDTIEALIKLADKYECDRNEVISDFADVLCAMRENVSFTNYQFKE
jgi:hypothetical protein